MEQNDDTIIHDDKLLYFNSFSELNEAVNSNLDGKSKISMDYPGFISFGNTAKSKYMDAYQKSKNKVFKTKDALLEFLDINKEYIEIEYDLDGTINVQPKSYDEYDDVLNSNRMVLVGNQVLKFFGEGVLVAKQEKTFDLINLESYTENSEFKALSSIENKVNRISVPLMSTFDRIPGLAYGVNANDGFADDHLTRYRDNGDHRIKIKLETSRGIFNSSIKQTFIVRAQERDLWVYWNVQRTISGYVAINHTLLLNDTYIDEGIFSQYFPAEHKFKHEVDVYDRSNTGAYGVVKLFENEYYMWGDAVNNDPIIKSDATLSLCSYAICNTPNSAPIYSEDPSCILPCGPGYVCVSGNCIPQ